VPAEVIGVMPASFSFPFEDAELWAPMLDELSTVPRTSRFFSTVGRLSPGIGRADAQHEMVVLAAELERAYPDSNRDWRPVITVAVRAITKEARPRLLLIFGAVVVVFLVAYVNVGAIVVMRAGTRENALRLRLALGAGRWDVGRLLLLENAWLAAAGLGGGLLVAAPSVAALKALAPEALPRVANISLSWTVLGWAALVTLVFAVAAAFAPLARARVLALSGIRSAAVAGRQPGWGRRAVTAAQIAGAFVLLVAAGLLVRSFARVLDVNPGFDPGRLAMTRVFLTPPVYRTVEQQIDYVRRGLESLRSTPGVLGVAAVSQTPFDVDGGGTTLAAAVEGHTYPPGSHPVVSYRLVAPKYFDVIDLPLLDGRAFTDDDRRGGPLVGIVNLAMAESLWPGERAIGRRFAFADGRDAGWITVVGVVGDVATDGLERREPPVVYAPYVQRTLPFLRWMTFVLRTDGDPAAALPSIRSRLRDVDPRQPIYSASTMTAAIARSTAERRFSVVLMAIFAGLTLVLAALGVYGVLAQGVTARRRELGVRLTLGAVPGQIFRLVITEAVRLVVAGLIVGACATAVAAPFIREALFGVTVFDLPTYASIVVALGAAAFLAGAAPAVSAAHTDPVRTLRDG
jgi:putative ABC transport system permease protein